MTLYPIAINYENDGAIIAKLVDFPFTEAVGDNTFQACDMLSHQFKMIAAERMAEGRRIPAPSPSDPHSPVLGLCAMETTKIEIYHLYLDSGMKRGEFARRMGVEANEIYRLFDLRQATSIARFERAAAALGKRFVISIVDGK